MTNNKELQEMKDVLDKLPPADKEKVQRGFQHIREVMAQAQEVHGIAHALGCQACPDPAEPTGW